ncbi:hypothetical protein R1flu_009780 [Riccia fluitans]|uniref:Reverse transcriptase zinc-binding domain-containing protein n=1 Tax=Riccia fluitans TaxID=41844 RepID=A0ABD1Z337_9MARC
MEETPEDMSGKWPAICLTCLPPAFPGKCIVTWKRWWRKLWEAGGTNRVKLWIWKLLQKAFFTGERAEKMRVASDPCSRCKLAVESVPHLFHDCNNSQVQWSKLLELMTKAGVSMRVPHGLLNIINEALTMKKKGGPLIYLLYSITTTIWRDRNQAQFNNKILSMPFRISLEQARVELEGSLNAKSSAIRWQHRIDALDVVNKLISSANSLRPRPGHARTSDTSEHPKVRSERNEQGDINFQTSPRAGP